MPKFKLHAVECITQEEGRRVNVKTRVRQGIVSAHRGRLCAAFPGSSGGTLSTENITQHNTTQHNTHTHTGRKWKGKKPSLDITLAALLELLPQRVFSKRQGSTPSSRKSSWFSTRSYSLKLHFRFSPPPIFTVIWVQHYITLHALWQ